MPALCNRVRLLRQRAGLQQQELARRAGVSRQTMHEVESAKTAPSTALALKLAAVLACRVEDLFSLERDSRPLSATLVGQAASELRGRRVILGMVKGRWVAHGLDGDDLAGATTAGDGLMGPAAAARSPRRARGTRQSRSLRQPGIESRRVSVQVSPLRDREELAGNLLVAGCDFAIGLLGEHARDRGGPERLRWIEAGSEAALDALERGHVHVAGLHLLDRVSGQYNLPAVRSRFRDASMLVVNLAVWEQGLVMRRGSPSRWRRPEVVVDRGLRVALREPGSEARAVFDRWLSAHGVSHADLVAGKIVANSHHAIARAVALDAADIGVATRAAAAALDLEFVPLAEERGEDRFDLVLHADTARSPAGQRMLDTLGSARFKRELGALAGYGTASTGRVLSEGGGAGAASPASDVAGAAVAGGAR